MMEAACKAKASSKADSSLDKWESIYMSWGSFLNTQMPLSPSSSENRYAPENPLQQSKTSNTKQNSSSESPWKVSEVVGE